MRPDAREQPTQGVGPARATRERIEVGAGGMVEAVTRLIDEGNVRRLVIRHEGRTVMEIPLSTAAAGPLVAALLAAVGALAGVAGRYTLDVERAEEQV